MAEENKKISGYTKLEKYNKPVGIIFLAGFGALVASAMQPILGILFAKFLGILSVPKEYLDYIHGESYLKDEVTKFTKFMIYAAIANGVAIVLQKYSFGYLGYKVTQRVREALY